MTKTRAALVLVLLLGIAAAVWVGTRRRTAASSDGPIVIFSIDTLRADRLPAYGYTRIATPHIDRLVRDGILFENAYSHSPQTLPAHASLLSGQLPFEHGVRDNVGFTVRQGQPFLQHALKEHGFGTAGFVSAYVLRKQTGISQGFDVYDDDLPAAAPDRPLGQVQRAGSDTVAAAARWIDGQKTAKFLLFVHIYEPHRPYSPPARFAGGEPYDGEVQHADEIVGQMIDHLKAKDLYDRSTFVLLSDHGEGLGDHGEDEHGIFLYRETIQIPLVVKLPGSLRGGTRVKTAVQHIDLAPTILDIAGAAARAPQAAAGRSLRPALEGTGKLPDASIYSEALWPRYHFGWSELYALTDDRYRLIRAPRDELYDLQQDPHERTSIAVQRPQVRSAMRRALDALISNVRVDAPSPVSEQDREKLAALGYVGTQTGTALDVPGDQLPDPKDKIGVLRKYKQALELGSGGRLAEAGALFRDILQEEPDMTEVWLQLAENYNRRGMPADAVAAYQEIVKRNPKDAAGLTGASAGLLRLGRLDEARTHAELAVDIAPATAHDLLARVAVEKGDVEAARREARLAHDADPTMPMPAFIEGLLRYKQQQYAAALPHLLEAKRMAEARTVQLADVNYLIADSLARLERYAEAEPYFRAELAVFPNHVRAHAGLAMLYRAMGRIADSERVIASLIQRAPTREGYDVAGQLWTMFGEPARAAAVKARAERLPR